MANQVTPLAVDAYGRFMVDVFDEREIIGVPTAFQAFFGRPETGAKTLFSPNASVVDIDILRGNERIAALVQRGSNARPISGQKNTDEQKWSAFSRLYPLAEEEGDITADQLNRRVAGENPYSSITKLDRLRLLALNHHHEHMRRITRLFEYLSAQSVLTGKMPSILGTTNNDLIYDFRRNAAHTITVGIKWDAGATAVIMADIDGGCEKIRANGHANPDMIVIGSSAVDAMINDTTIQTQADNRRFELIEVSTNNPVPPNFKRFVDAGLTPRGRLRTPKGYTLWIFTYSDVYTNSAGTATPYMPVDEALIAYSGARCDRYFGPSEILPLTAGRSAWYQETFGFNPASPPMPPNVKDLSNALNPAMFYCDAYPSANQKAVTIRTQAAPIFATTMTDAFVTLNGLV